MDGLTIFNALVAQGRKVVVQDDKLSVTPSKGLTDAQKQAIRRHKDGIIRAAVEDAELERLLALGDDLWLPDWRERLEAAC